MLVFTLLGRHSLFAVLASPEWLAWLELRSLFTWFSPLEWFSPFT
jgi:hypothetical protein